jgi:hypothetical protein
LKRGDRIMLCICLVFAVSAALFFAVRSFGLKREICEAEISKDGEIVRIVELKKGMEPEEFRVGGSKNYNVIRAEDGSIFVADSDCKGRDCVKSGRIGRAGGAIVCLPHKLVITVRGSGGVDAATY